METRSRGLGRAVRVVIWSLAVLSLMGASCAGEEAPVPPTGDGANEPPDPLGAPPVGGGKAEAALVDVVRMYVDRPAARDLRRDQVDPTNPGDEGVDFRAVTRLSSQGQIVDSRLVDRRNCAAPTSQPRTLKVPAQYPTIRAAIEVARPGDEVLVAPGTYRENLVLRSGIRLVGAGAWQTILDGEGKATSIIDFTSARDVLVTGFTLRGAGKALGCARPEDPFACSGNWYAAAIYGDGHNAVEVGASACDDTSIVITQNIFHDNFMAVMAYFHARTVIRNNIFVGNRFGFVANHLQDHALVMHNAFIDNRLAIGSQAAYLDVFGNIIAGSDVGVTHEYIQMGRIACNAFAGNTLVGERVPIGQDGNVSAERAFVAPERGDYRPTPELVAALSICLDDPTTLAEWLRREPGAFGGSLGAWSLSPAGR